MASRFSGHGYLLFYRENAVYAQPFDSKKLAVKNRRSGEPVRVADEVGHRLTAASSFAVSANGVLAYFSASGTVNANAGAESDSGEWQLAWIDRNAKVLDTPGPPGPYRGLEVSPDGKRIAVHRHDAKGGDIVVIEPRQLDEEADL